MSACKSAIAPIVKVDNHPLWKMLKYFDFRNFWSSICIQLLLFHNNQNNVDPHFFLVTLEFLELSCRDNIKRNHGEIWTFPPKTPTLYQWTTVSMAVDNNSVHSVSKQYQDVACETSLRYHLKKLNMEELIKSNEKILLQELIKTLKTGKSYEFAIDLTDDPYYGKTDSSNEKYVIHGQAKKSTNSFYSYASLYITNKNE